MAMIPEEEIERIKRETDLAAVVRSRGIELKPQGGDLIGLCPFHSDTRPSLHVTAAKRLWRCVSCQATGNVIQFVEKFDGVSFRHAFELLKAALDAGGDAVPAPPRTGAPLKRATVPKLASPLAVDADDQAALRQVVDYYHARLKENPAALAYLAKRGLRSEEALTTFKLGFVDRTLGLRLPQKNRAAGATLRARLARLGVMRETGHEHFRGRIVFPIIAEDGEIGTIYGRAIGDVAKPDRHLFLAGPQRGVWNPAALRAPEVILTEGIIDALTFWCAGFRHVTTCYSARQPSGEVLAALLAAKVQRILLAFNRDRAGDTGTDGATAQLAAYGIECLRVMFPPGHDANSYALSVTPSDKSLGLLLRSAVPLDPARRDRLVSPPPVSRAPVSSLAAEAAKVADAAPKPGAAETPSTPPSTQPVEAAKEKAPVETSSAPTPTAGANANEATAAAATPPASPSSNAVTLAKNEPEEVVLLIGDRAYRVRGLAKNAGIESLKVTLRIVCAERWHMDNVDLCVARERERFINAAACETALKPELIKRDLGRVLFTLEQLQEQRLRAATTPQKPAAKCTPSMTPWWGSRSKVKPMLPVQQWLTFVPASCGKTSTMCS